MSFYKQLSSTAFFRHGFLLLILFSFASLSAIGYFHLHTLAQLKIANVQVLKAESQYQQLFYQITGEFDYTTNPSINLIEINEKHLKEDLFVNNQLSISALKQLLKTLYIDAELIEGEYTYSFLDIPPNPPVLLLLVRSIDKAHLTKGLYQQTFILTFIGFLLLLGFSYFIRHHFLRKLTFISNTANEILLGDLSKRIPVTEAFRRNPDEVSEVSIALNSMLDKIETLMTEVKQISNNIAHDLKSPINRIRSRMDVGLLNSRSEEDYQDILSQSIDDLDGLLATINALLLIANIDNKKRSYELVPLNLSRLLDDMVELYQTTVTEDDSHPYQINLYKEDNCFIRGNKNLLAQVLSNLIENAIKYAQRADTLINISAKCSNEFVEIIIADNGAGIPTSLQEKVFEPFVRVDSSRTLPGTGLGLSLVKSIIQLHNGWVSLDKSELGGLQVNLKFRRIPLQSIDKTIS